MIKGGREGWREGGRDREREGGREGPKPRAERSFFFCPLLPKNTQPKGLHSKYSILIYFTSFLSKKRNRTDCHGKKSLILTKLFPLGNTPLRESGKEKQED